MRRKDREKDAVFALEVMRDCEYATLATVNPDKTCVCKIEINKITGKAHIKN